jgi:hypothetical protein
MKRLIVGEWTWDTLSYNFHRDGTYEYLNTYSGVRTNGRYCIEGNTIMFFFDSGGGSTGTLELNSNGNELKIIPINVSSNQVPTFTRES